MKAVVIGCAGFLGRNLVKELEKRKIETLGYDLLPVKDVQYIFGKNFTVHYIEGDILDLDSLKSVMKGCDLVFHTAAIADINDTRFKPVETMEINVVGTAKCLEAARRAGVKRFLYASSVYVSGNRGSFYRVSKQAGESLCKMYAEEFGLQYSILRYGSLYGREANHWNFIYGVCKDLLVKGEFTYNSSPDSVREFIHIYDAACETVRIALDNDFINKSVLISGHQRLKMSEFFDMVQEILGNKTRIHYASTQNHAHYIKSPYSFEIDVPVRVNLSNYIDISEGILDCLNEVKKELEDTEKQMPEHAND